MSSQFFFRVVGGYNCWKRNYLNFSQALLCGCQWTGSGPILGWFWLRTATGTRGFRFRTPERIFQQKNKNWRDCQGNQRWNKNWLELWSFFKSECFISCIVFYVFICNLFCLSIKSYTTKKYLNRSQYTVPSFTEGNIYFHVCLGKNFDRSVLNRHHVPVVA